MMSEMKVIQNKKFEDFYDADSGEIFENIQFEKCDFNYCNISQTENPYYRTTIKNIVMKKCSLTSCSIGSAIVEDCLFDNNRNNGLLQIRGALFNQVKIKGKIGRLMIRNEILSNNKEVVEAFKLENKEYYASIDWALDISEAEPLELDIKGIPCDLIKINPSTQAIVRKKNVPKEWKEIKFNDGVIKIILMRLMEESEYEDIVIVAPNRDKKSFNNMRKDIELLRKLGIADRK